MDQKSKKVLVTGGAGFIGSNLVDVLIERGFDVVVIDNLSTGNKENIKNFLNYGKFKFINGSLTDLNVCRQAVKGIDYIFHLAAIPSVFRSVENPLATNEANISGTLNLLIAARDEGSIKKFVYSSSSSVYGDSPKLPKQEDDPVNPISPYALSKYTGERYCQIFNKIFGLPTICLRYFNVFGPRQNPLSQYGAAIPKFVFSMIQNKSPIIYGDGEQTRDFTYVDNVVEANVLAVQSKHSGEVINVACNQRISLNQIIELINGFLKTNIKALYYSPRPGDVRHSLADVSKAKELLSYHPKVYFEEGLRETINWFKGLKIYEITERFASIRPAEERDINQISGLYQKEIKTGFLSSFGPPFLNKLFQAIIRFDDTFCIVAELDNQLAGFIVGVVNANKFYRDFTRKYSLRAGLSILLKSLKAKNLKKILETIFYLRKEGDLPPAELFVIVVGERFQRQKLGTALLENFIAEMKRLGVKSFRSTVSEKFKPTIAFYTKMGFKFHQPTEVHKGQPSKTFTYNVLTDKD